MGVGGLDTHGTWLLGERVEAGPAQAGGLKPEHHSLQEHDLQGNFLLQIRKDRTFD